MFSLPAVSACRSDSITHFSVRRSAHPTVHSSLPSGTSLAPRSSDPGSPTRSSTDGRANSISASCVLPIRRRKSVRAPLPADSARARALAYAEQVAQAAKTPGGLRVSRKSPRTSLTTLATPTDGHVLGPEAEDLVCVSDGLPEVNSRAEWECESDGVCESVGVNESEGVCESETSSSEPLVTAFLAHTDGAVCTAATQKEVRHRCTRHPHCQPCMITLCMAGCTLG